MEAMAKKDHEELKQPASAGFFLSEHFCQSDLVKSECSEKLSGYNGMALAKSAINHLNMRSDRYTV